MARKRRRRGLLGQTTMERWEAERLEREAGRAKQREMAKRKETAASIRTSRAEMDRRYRKAFEVGFKKGKASCPQPKARKGGRKLSFKSAVKRCWGEAARAGKAGSAKKSFYADCMKRTFKKA